MYKVCARHQGTVVCLAEFKDREKAENLIKLPIIDEIDPEYVFYPDEMYVEVENDD